MPSEASAKFFIAEVQLQIKEPARQNSKNLLASNFCDNFVKLATQNLFVSKLKNFADAELFSFRHAHATGGAIQFNRNGKHAQNQSAPKPMLGCKPKRRSCPY